MRALAGVFIMALSALVFADNTTANAADDSDLSPEAVMDRLIEKGFGHAVKAIESNGGFYPFGLIRDDKGRVHFLSYGGGEDRRPRADQYAYELIWQLRNVTAENAQIRSAIVVRPTALVTEDGGRIPAIHFIVDHRDSRARTVVFPIHQQDDGEYYLGDPVVLDSEDFLMMNSPDAELQRDTGEPQ